MLHVLHAEHDVPSNAPDAWNVEPVQSEHERSVDGVGELPYSPVPHFVQSVHEVPSKFSELWNVFAGQSEQTRSKEAVGELPFFPVGHLVHAEQVTDAASFCAWYMLPVHAVQLVDFVAKAKPAWQKEHEVSVNVLEV